MEGAKAVKFHEYQPGIEDFQLYMERLNYCFQANGITNENTKKANFFTVCGIQVYETVLALITPFKSQDVPYNNIIELLDNHYKQRANEITMSYKFYNRNQKIDEKAGDYITELRKISVHCNFSDLERNLRDRLVCGMKDEKLKFELLRREGLTYQQVVDAMMTAESAYHDINIMRGDIVGVSTSQQSQPMDIGAVRDATENNAKYRFCYRCGEKHSGQCRHINTICNYCNKKGHLEKICIFKKKATNRKVNYTSEKGLEYNDLLNGIYCINSSAPLNKIPPINLNVIICGIPICMQIDSGAAYTILNVDTYHKLPNWQKNKLKPLSVQLSTWTNTPVKIMGQMDLNVQINNSFYQLTAIVADGRGPNLLGRNWFRALNIMISAVNLVDKIQVCEDLIVKYKDIFSPGLGTYRGAPVTITLKQNAVPKYFKARPVPFALKERIENEIDRLVTEGVLRPTPFSDWATPVVPIIKRNGDIRLCGDYRATVNQATESDTYPMPSANEIFAQLAGGRYFSTLDLDRAYTQVTVTEDTAKLLTLNTCKGLFSVHRLAFGVKASPGIFQRIMTSLLSDIPGVAVLLDDIIVTGHTYEEMHNRLDKILQKISEAGLRLNKEKCKFAKNKVEFLGFVVDGEGIHPAPSKIEAICKTPSPKNKQELQAFLGLYNFYERFVYHKATIMEPLHRLLDEKEKWQWTEKEQKAFNFAKTLLTTEITLTHYDIHRKLLLTCDASEYGLGVVLSHIMDNGEEKPIAMGSRTLHPHERRYSQLDKEAAAISFGIKKFHNYLLGRSFTIITDHKPLLGIFNPERKMPDLLSPRLVRICLALSAHCYNIQYRPGHKITDADSLSRWPLPVKPEEASIPEEILLMAESPQDLPFGSKEIAEETAKDSIFNQIVHFILKGWPERVSDKQLHIFWLHRNHMSIQDGCILMGNRVVLPPKLREVTLQLLHQTHGGIVHTKSLARSYIWWPNMDRDIEEIINNCTECLEYRNMPKKSTHEWIQPCRPWSRIHIDFAGPFQNKTFFIVVDSYSKWPEVHIVNSMNSTTVIKLLRYMFAQHGLCETLVSDNGTPFISKEFEEFLSSNKIKHVKTAPYHPATNGQAERMVQTIKNKLKKMTSTSWDTKLPNILLALRTTPSTTTKKCPAEMLMGRQLRTLLDTIHPKNSLNKKIEEQIAKNASIKNRETNTGKKVMYRNYTSTGPKWLSGRIQDKNGPSSYTVVTDGGETVKRHVDQLIVIKESGQEKKEEGESEMEHDEESSRIVDMEVEVAKNGSEQLDDKMEDIIEIPDAEQWEEILGIPSSYGKVKKKSHVHLKSPYEKS